MENPSQTIFVNFGSSFKGDLSHSVRILSRKIVGIESVNDSSFNDSKFYGYLSFCLALGFHIFLDDGETVVTKKGGLSLPFHLSKRVPNVDYSIVLVDYKGSDAGLLKLKQCSQEEMIERALNLQKAPENVSLLSLTFGYSTSFRLENDETGHVTRDFNVSYDTFISWLENQRHVGKIYKGEILKFQVDGKKTGHVVSVPELDNDTRKNSHITVRSPIKAVLSGAIVEKFEQKIFQFHLKDIDPNSKTDALISVETSGNTDVKIENHYVYAVEVSKK